LKQRLKEIQERRKRLERLKQQIEQDWMQDRFQDVLDGLEDMKNPKSGDPVGRYGIGPAITLKARERDRERILARGIQEAEELARSCKVQVDEMEAWLRRLEGWYDWPSIRTTADKLVERGEFEAALRLGQEICGPHDQGELTAWLEKATTEFEAWRQAIKRGDETKYIPLSSLGLLTLEQAIAYLRQPPIHPHRLLSRSARSVWDEASGKLRQARQTLDDVKQYLEDTRNKQDAWNQAYRELGRAKQEWEKLESNPFSRWLRSEQIDEAREETRLALVKCKRLCPNHPTIVHFDNLWKEK
jgi:hypothetical protein